MSRKTTSQWDFGELFPERSLRRVVSVTELTQKIKGLLEQQFGEVWVSGEITNLRAQASGHIYFSLKDPNAALNCVLFRGTAVGVRSVLKDGQKIVVQGDLTVYEPRGQYQLVVRSVELQGIGALQAAFERLKEKLAAEGLFDSARKRPIPRYPRILGIVTSPTGAALRDVWHVIERRFAGLELVLAPSRVQGEGAAQGIATAIQALNRWGTSMEGRRLDVILITRGGGSLEDLWAFNEEVVARAIFGSHLPVVSAVGHEIDFTIADFVADLRAATPSAAAELLTAGYAECREVVFRHGQRLSRRVAGVVGGVKERVTELQRRLARGHPRRRLNEQLQRLDDAQLGLVRRGRETFRSAAKRLESLTFQLAAVRPAWRLERAKDQLGRAETDLRQAAGEGAGRVRTKLERLELRLRMLSPEQILARGYSITSDAMSGQVLRRAAEAGEGRELRTRLQSGEVFSIVTRAAPAMDASAASTKT